jgi:hypothetical protein
MKRFLLLTPLLIAASANAADPPAKRGGGLFGFGAPKSEQISSGLFPERGNAAESSNAIVTSSSNAPTSGSGGSEIFRSGQPQAVDAVSYVIQNGRKVERPIEALAPVAAPAAPAAAAPVAQAVAPAASSGVELASDEGRKRGGFFAFGRRGDSADENEVVTPVPTEGGFAPPRAAPSVAPAPAPVVAAPAPPAIPTAPATPAVPVTETAETPNFAGVEKEKGDKFGWIPFMGRKKQDAAPVMETAAPVVATAEPIVAAPAPTGAAPAPAKPATSTTAAPAKPAAATTASTTAPTTTFEVPRDDSKKEEKKEVKPGSSGGGLLSPIANIRVPRKEIDLTSAETIIQNGEIVAGSETNFETVPEPSSTGQRQAPQVVNGVKTYSSWDDVNARSSSAADKIIGSMR